MRATKAKAIRQRARAAAPGVPDRVYESEVTGRVFAKKPDGSLDPMRFVEKRTFRLRRDCLRAHIKRLKSA